MTAVKAVEDVLPAAAAVATPFSNASSGRFELDAGDPETHRGNQALSRPLKPPQSRQVGPSKWPEWGELGSSAVDARLGERVDRPFLTGS